MQERDNLQKEIGDSLDSLTHQYKSSLEFTDELWIYIKEYLEKDVTEYEHEFKRRIDIESVKLWDQFEP